MNSKYNKEDLERMILIEKLSYEEIGRRYGVSGNCVKKWAKKIGIDLSRKRKINSEETFNKGRSLKYKKEDLINYDKNGLSYSEIAKIYGVSKEAIYSAFRRFNIKKTRKLNAKRLIDIKSNERIEQYISIIENYPDDDFKKIVKSDMFISDVLRSLKLPVNTKLYKPIRDKISRLELSIKSCKSKGERHNINYYLRNNSGIASSKLRDRLFRSGIKERKCECCGITEWNGKPAPLELHHIDGNHGNNSLENLQILCPNCHAQTENYCGKDKKKK